MPFNKLQNCTINKTQIPMKYLIGLLTTLTLSALLFLSGCDSPDNEMESAENSTVQENRDLEIASSDMETDLRTYRVENSDRFMEFDRTINEIEQEIENESDDEVREELEEKLEEVKENQNELKREMDNYEASGSENWDDFKDSFSDKMDDFGDSLDDFFSTENTNTSSIN